MPKKSRAEQSGYLLPYTIDPPQVCICMHVPCDPNHALAFLGQLVALGNWWTWERDDLHQGTEAARVWRGIYEDVSEQLNQCGVFDMTCGCNDNPGRQFRINEDGVYEYSDDGGATWTPAPELDPRNTATIFPPIPTPPGGTKKCQSAQNMVATMQQMVDEIQNGLDLGIALTALVAVVLAFAATLLSGGTLGAPATALAAGAFGAGSAAFAAAFTSAVWEAVECALICNMADDGSLTNDQLNAAYDEISESVIGIALTAIGHIFATLGAVGMTNAGRVGVSSGVGCGDCECNECAAYSEGEPGNLSAAFQFFPGPTPTVPLGWSFEGDYNLASHQLFIGDCGEPEGVLIAPMDICIQRITGSYDTGIGATNRAILNTGGDVSPDQNPTFDYVLSDGRITDRVIVTNNGIGGDCIGLSNITIWYREI